MLIPYLMPWSLELILDCDLILRFVTHYYTLNPYFSGKYTDAAQMPQVKVLRLFLQMLKNLWAPVYVGGAHPFHHEVPKPIVQLFKEKIVEFFFPQIGDEGKH